MNNGLESIERIATNLSNDLFAKEKINTINELNFNFIFDEEFVNLINSLSSGIKDFMKNCTSNTKNATINSDQITDNIGSSKLLIQEIIQQVNLYSQHSKNLNPNNNKTNNIDNTNNNKSHYSTSYSNAEKNLREKLIPLVEKLDAITEQRINLSKNLKNIEVFSTKFYEEAKVTFKNLKNLHSQKLSELQKYNNDLFQEKENANIQNRKIEKNINGYNINKCEENKDITNSNRNFNNNYDRFIIDEQEPIPQELNIHNQQNIENENNIVHNLEMEIDFQNNKVLNEKNSDGFSQFVKNIKKNQKVTNSNNLIFKLNQNFDCNSNNKNNLSNFSFNNNSQNNTNVKSASNKISNNHASIKPLNQKKLSKMKTSIKEISSISPLNKKSNTNNFLQNNQQSLILNTSENCFNNSTLLKKNNNLFIPNNYLNNSNKIIDYNDTKNEINNNDLGKNQYINKSPKFNLIKQPFLNNVDAFSRSNSNPRTCKNIKYGRLSKLENLNMLNNQSNLNINFPHVLNTPTNLPIYHSNKSKPNSQISNDISSFEHLNKLSKINLNRQNRNKNPHSLYLNHQYYNNSIGETNLYKNNNIIIKNFSNSIDDKEVLNNKKTKMANKQINTPLMNKTIYELSLKYNELNEELNKLHESYNILESENIKLKQLNDKVSKFSIVKRSNSNNWKEKSSGLSIKNKFINNINNEEIQFNNYSSFNKKTNQGLEFKHIYDPNNENNEIYNNSNEINNQQIIYDNYNLINGDNTNFNQNTSKSVEISKQKSSKITHNKINNKNNLYKLGGNNSIDLNHVGNNNQNLRESNLILNSNLNSKSSNSTKFNILSFIILSEKVINFIRILNNFLEEIDRKSSKSQINEIRSILNTNKQELIQLANDFLVKSKTLVDENNVYVNSQNAQDLVTSHTPTQNLNYNKSSKNIHNLNTPYENKCSSDMPVNIPYKKLGLNNSHILEIKSNSNNKSSINNINSNAKLEKNIELSKNNLNSTTINPSNDIININNNYKKKPAEILKEYSNMHKSGSKSNLRSNKIINFNNQNQSSNFKKQYMNASNLNNFSNIAANEVSNENYLNTTKKNIKHFSGAAPYNPNNLYNIYLSNLNKLNNININTCKNSNVKSIYSSFKTQNNKKTMANKSLGKIKNKNNFSCNYTNNNMNSHSKNNNDYSYNNSNDIMFNENTEIDFRNSEKNLNLFFERNKKDQNNDPNIKSKSSNLLDNDSNLIYSNGNITDEENAFNKSKKNKNIISNIIDSDIESDIPFNSTLKLQANKNPCDSKGNSRIISLQNSDNGVNKINSLLEKNISSQNPANNNSTSNLSNLNKIAIISNTNLNLNDFDDLNSFTINQRGNYLNEFVNSNNIINNYKINNNFNDNCKNNISLQMLKNNYIKTNFNNFCNNNFSTENNILTNFESCENQKSEQNIINTNANTNSNPNFNSSNFINSINIINNTDKNNEDDYKNKNKGMISNLKNKNSFNNNNYVLDIRDLNSNAAEKLQIKLLDSKKYLNEYYKLNRKTQENNNLSDNDNIDNDIDIKKSEENFELENPITEKKAKNNFNEKNINHNPKSLDNHEYLTALRLNINLQEINEKLNKEIETLKKQNIDLIAEIELNKKEFEKIKENENFKEEYEAFKFKRANENSKCEQIKMQIEINQLKTENEKLNKELIDSKNNIAIEEKINICDNCKILEKNSNANLIVLEDFKKELNKLNKTIKEKEKQIKNYQNEIDKIILVSDQKEMLINKLNKKIRILERNEKAFNLEQSNKICNNLIDAGIDDLNIAFNPISKQNSSNSNIPEMSEMLQKIEEFDKQVNWQKNTINELNIKLKVNKNERDSLVAEIEMLKKQSNELNFKNEINEGNNISTNNNKKYIKTEESDKNFKLISSGKIENLNTNKNLEIENQNLQLKLESLSEMKTMISKLEDENSNLLQELSLKQSDYENFENLIAKLKEDNKETKKENETLLAKISSFEKKEDEKAKIYEEKLDHLQKKFKMISVDNENLKNQNFNIKNEFDIYVNENNKSILKIDFQSN